MSLENSREGRAHYRRRASITRGPRRECTRNRYDASLSRRATRDVRRVGRATGVSHPGRVFMAEKIFYHNNTEIRSRGRLPRPAQMSARGYSHKEASSCLPLPSRAAAAAAAARCDTRSGTGPIGYRDYQKIIGISIEIRDPSAIFIAPDTRRATVLHYRRVSVSREIDPRCNVR